MALIDIGEDEDRFRRELEAFEEWTTTGRAVMALGQLLLKLPRTAYAGPRDEAGPALQLAAQRIVGIRIFRTIRAASAVLSFGYEPEARALDRILVELIAHRRLIQNDSTGEEAKQWLEGKGGAGITRKVNLMQPDDLYSSLSQDAHGDPRPVWRLWDPVSDSLMIGPHRQALAARASLLMYAGTAHDHTALLATLSGLEVPDLDPLAELIRAGWRHLEADGDAQGM